MSMRLARRKIFGIKLLINSTQKKQESPLDFIVSKGNGKKLEQNPQKGKTKEKSGYMGWLCKGKVLAPLTSIILHRNHLKICIYKKVGLFVDWV